MAGATPRDFLVPSRYFHQSSLWRNTHSAKIRAVKISIVHAACEQPHRIKAIPATVTGATAAAATPARCGRVTLHRREKSYEPVDKAESVNHFRFTNSPFFDCSDRKSTRLNSSHRCISYAVFCL